MVVPFVYLVPVKRQDHCLLLVIDRSHNVFVDGFGRDIEVFFKDREHSVTFDEPNEVVFALFWFGNWVTGWFPVTRESELSV